MSPGLGASEFLVVAGLVDIEQDTNVFDRHLHDPLGMVAEDGPAAHVPAQVHHFREHRAIQQHGVAPETVVGGNHDLGAGARVLCDQPIQGRWADKWLVCQNYERRLGLRIDGGESGFQRAAHSSAIIPVHHQVDLFKVQLSPDRVRRMAENEDDFADPGGANIVQHVFEQRPAVDLEQLFHRSHPG